MPFFSKYLGKILLITLKQPHVKVKERNIESTISDKVFKKNILTLSGWSILISELRGLGHSKPLIYFRWWCIAKPRTPQLVANGLSLCGEHRLATQSQQFAMGYSN